MTHELFIAVRPGLKSYFTGGFFTALKSGASTDRAEAPHYLAGAGEDEGHVVGLLGAANPVGDGGSYNFTDA